MGPHMSRDLHGEVSEILSLSLESALAPKLVRTQNHPFIVRRRNIGVVCVLRSERSPVRLYAH
jgi:uncharacterized membrane protein